jgi:predicted transglutaminase-like cysteine proteinase
MVLKALLHTHVCSAQAMPFPSTGPSKCTRRSGYEFCRRHLQNCDWQICQTGVWRILSTLSRESADKMRKWL